MLIQLYIVSCNVVAVSGRRARANTPHSAAVTTARAPLATCTHAFLGIGVCDFAHGVTPLRACNLLVQYILALLSNATMPNSCVFVRFVFQRSNASLVLFLFDNLFEFAFHRFHELAVNFNELVEFMVIAIAIESELLACSELHTACISCETLL